MSGLFHHYEEIDPSPGGRVVTIGNFDGVHVGHVEVLRAGTRSARERGLQSAALTFEPHPTRLLKADAVPLRLTGAKEKVDLLFAAGVDVVLAQRFDREFASLSPADFAQKVLADAMGARLVIVGENFGFGAGRAGGIGALEELGGALGFEVRVEPAVEMDGEIVSSSRIRALLLDGRVEDAARLLGRTYCINATVIHGKGKGRILGFPTVNLEPAGVLVPGPGIYAARCTVGETIHPAAAYAGSRPTLGHGETLEAHLLGFEGDLYGEEVKLELVARVRGERRFADGEELSTQMGRDVERIRLILGGSHG